MRISSLVEIYWCLLKLSSEIENMDGRTDRHTGDQRDTIITRYYRVTGYQNKDHFICLQHPRKAAADY